MEITIIIATVTCHLQLKFRTEYEEVHHQDILLILQEQSLIAGGYHLRQHLNIMVTVSDIAMRVDITWSTNGFALVGCPNWALVSFADRKHVITCKM